MEKIPMTAAGFKGLEDELNQLKNVDRHEIIKAIAEARAHGDLSEKCRVPCRQGEGRASSKAWSWNWRIRSAAPMWIDISKPSGTSVIFGATVTLVDEDTDEERKFQIVGDVESDAKQGRISLSFPLRAP